MLRRSLIIWGWGHIALGDRRGWFLVALQTLAIAAWLFVAWQLIDGTRWLVVFVPLVLIVVFWVGQAVHAYRRALALGGASGGELQLALFLPLVLAVFTSFWLVGGRHASPASTVEGYMDALQANRPDLARTLFADWSPSAAEMDVYLQSELGYISTVIDHYRAVYGPESGLDPQHPFASIRVEPTGPEAVFRQNPVIGPQPVTAQFLIEVVRSERFETTLLGIIPTAGVRTVVVAPVYYIELTETTSPTGAALPSSTWRISSVVQQNVLNP